MYVLNKMAGAKASYKIVYDGCSREVNGEGLPPGWLAKTKKIVLGLFQTFHYCPDCKGERQ